MTTSPDFLSVEDVEQLHREQLELFGGRDGIRDRHALESAVGTPAATFDGQYLHVSLFSMAAAYAFHIAEDQPFVDGNKRTALNTALVFLGLNGWEVDDPDGLLYDANAPAPVVPSAAHTAGDGVNYAVRWTLTAKGECGSWRSSSGRT